MKKLILFIGVAVLSMGNISESKAAISCVFSDGGKTVTITGSGNDTFSSCTQQNSSSADSDWTFDSNYKKQ